MDVFQERVAGSYVLDRDTARDCQLLHQRQAAAHMLARGDQQAPVAHAAEHLGRDAGLRLFQAGGPCASGKSGDRSINQGLVGPHRHGGVAVDIDNQHEHAVVLRVRTLGQ